MGCYDNSDQKKKKESWKRVWFANTNNDKDKEDSEKHNPSIILWSSSWFYRPKTKVLKNNRSMNYFT